MNPRKTKCQQTLKCVVSPTGDVGEDIAARNRNARQSFQML